MHLSLQSDTWQPCGFSECYIMKKENVGLMLASGARLSTLINYAADIEAVNPHARSPALMC